MKLKIFIILVVLLIVYLIFSNTPIMLSNENSIHIDENNKATILYSYNIKNKKSVNSQIKQKPISNLLNDITDKPLRKPNEFKPFVISSNIDLNQNLYVPPLNQYDVQSGIHDNNLLPKPQIYKPIGVEIKNRVDLDSNDSNIYIHEIYDEILNDRPVSSKELDNDKYKIVPAYKGYSLGIDNWNYYKNEDYANGGAYQNLIGIEYNKLATQRVIDGYNDFVLQEWK